jgi:Tol biopolymer transport system component
MRWKLLLSVLVVCLLVNVSLAAAVVTGKKGGGGKPQPPADPAIAYRIGDSIWVMNDDGSNQAVVLDEAEYPGFEVSGAPSWSPDGASLAFAGHYNTDGTYGIFILDITIVDGVPQGSGFRQIVSDESELCRTKDNLRRFT